MLPTRILLAVLASAVVTSAAPHHLVHRQEGESTPEGNDVVTPAVETPTDGVVAATSNDIRTPGEPTQTITGPEGTRTDDVALVPFGTCQSQCSGAFDDLPNNCGDGKDASKCATACTMWVDKLNTCVDCMSKTANADNDSIEKVNRWTTAAGSCPSDSGSDPFSGLVFGNCDACRPALEAINADPKSCNPEQLKSCQKCMDESKEEPVANQAAKDRVQAELSKCSSAPTGCEDKCKTLMGLQANCAPGSDQLYPLSCADSCPSKMDDVYACVSCYKDNGGVPQDISDLESSVTFYCSPEGCYSACVSVGKITDKCTEKDACKKNLCEGDPRQRLGQCRSCLENAPMDKKTRDTMFEGVAQAYDLCEKDIWPGGGSECGGTCDSILDMSYNSCRNKDINQCAAVCAPDNLNALQGCMECAADGSVDNFFNQMRDWCKDDGGGNPIVVVVNPSVTVTVPNRAPPTGIAPASRPSGKKGGITINTSRPIVTTRRATGVNSASSITELSLTFGGVGFGAALGLVLGIVAVVV